MDKKHGIGDAWELLFKWFPLGLFFVCLFLVVFLTVMTGLTGVLLFVLPFLGGVAFFVLLSPFFTGEKEDVELLRVVKELEKKQEFTLKQLSRKSGISVRRLESILEKLIPMCLYVFAYFSPEKKVYVEARKNDMHHCPRCASDFEERTSGKCHNCKLVFSRVLTRKPFYYL